MDEKIQSNVDFLPKSEAQQFRFIPSYLQNQINCELCAYEYDLAQRVPMMLCNSQHNCCLVCVKEIIIRKKQCPFCRTSISIDNIHKNRMLCRILQEVARKKGVPIKINQNPQKDFIQKRKSLSVLAYNEEINIPPDINALLNNDSILNDYRALIQENIQPDNITCWQKIKSRVQCGQPLYCFAYFLVMLYNFPFFICQLNYSLNFDQQQCLDKDYGGGISLRQWMFSSSIIGLSMYGLQWLVILWKICFPRKKKLPQSLTILNILAFLLKFLGYNIFGFVVYGHIDSDGQATCSGSVLAYMEAIFIIQIVIVCGLCSLVDRRR